jgi:hypothetical protein
MITTAKNLKIDVWALLSVVPNVLLWFCSYAYRTIRNSFFLVRGPMRLLILFLSFGLCACRSDRPTADPATREVDSVVAQYYRDMSDRNWTAYRDHFWPQATLTTVWQPPGEVEPRVVVTTIESFLASTAQGPDSKPIFEERLLSNETRVLANLAHVWARYEARFGDSSSVMTWRGIDAFTWMKYDGRWRIVSVAYTDEPGENRGAP